MMVALVGSRGWKDRQAVLRVVGDLPPDAVVVSGGARGADTLAVAAARARGLQVFVVRPDYQRYGRQAPLRRNELIARTVTRMVAFWDGRSGGTAYAVSCMEKLGKPVEVVRELCYSVPSPDAHTTASMFPLRRPVKGPR